MLTVDQVREALRGRYAIERELGRGGMATVYLASDPKHKRSVAVKVLTPELAQTVGPDRFLREIEIAARLTHPHILPVFDSGEAGGLLYYVMPYIEGESLRHRLQRERQLPLEAAVQITREVADALDYAHRHGIVHRDIKPENVLLEEGHAVVADFGVARAIAELGERRLTETGLAVGTPYYMSPEQSAGDSGIDGRADLYALGCVLYEMLAGVPPFQGPTAQSVVRQQILETPRRLAVMRPGLPENVEMTLQRALAKVPQDRWATGAQFAAALATPTGTPIAGLPFRLSRRAVGILAAAALLVTTAAVALFARYRSHAGLDANLVAVAPFEILDPTLSLWREGLVDVLSRNLDGAGPLRTVAPTVVVRRWRGRVDQVSAAALGRNTGARLTVYGQVFAAGGDSVRITATMLDVATNRVIGEVELRDQGGRMDRLADSLTVRLLRELGRERPIGAVRLASLGSTSLPALRAFLQGEQFFRRTDWDSAIVYYQRAIQLDPSFGLAMRRIGLALGWQRSGFDSTSTAMGARAGTFNHGLAPRESLLVTGDSISAALYHGVPATENARLTDRLFATLTEATRRYPEDPEVWYALGDARFHFGYGPRAGVPEREVLRSFDRAIALDSAFGPAYIHPTGLGFIVGGSALADRYSTAYLALDPKDVNAKGVRLLDVLKHEPDPARRARMLDTSATEALFHAYATSYSWTDSAEIAVSVARVLQKRPAPDTLTGTYRLANELIYRGHLREAVQVAGTKATWIVSQAALLGAIPKDSAARTFDRMFRRDHVLQGEAIRWWAVAGDTGTIRDAIAYADGVAQGLNVPPDMHPDEAENRRAFGRYGAASLRAYLALARRDTTLALSRLLGLPDSICGGCTMDQLTTAQLLAARGRNREAAAILDRGRIGNASLTQGGLWALERARVAERLGRRDQALEDYRFVTDVWRGADVELRPFVDEARAAILRLSGEPVRN